VTGMDDTSAGSSALAMFHAPFYIRHNQRRLEHLASLGLDLTEKSVLEPGAGIGDHSLFYLDRGCRVTAVEPRSDNCAAFRKNIAQSRTPHAGKITLTEADIWAIEAIRETFDVVHCYGLLYHLDDPARAIRAMAARTHGLLLLETCVTAGDGIAINIVDEPAENPTQASRGFGCRPTRAWLAQDLRRYFEHVYTPLIQPAHEEFPETWDNQQANGTWDLKRIVLIASRVPLDTRSLRPITG
jgi:SAM-dependent methyltransferase